MCGHWQHLTQPKRCRHEVFWFHESMSIHKFHMWWYSATTVFGDCASITFAWHFLNHGIQHLMTSARKNPPHPITNGCLHPPASRCPHISTGTSPPGRGDRSRAFRAMVHVSLIEEPPELTHTDLGQHLDKCGSHFPQAAGFGWKWCAPCASSKDITDSMPPFPNVNQQSIYLKHVGWLVDSYFHWPDLARL